MKRVVACILIALATLLLTRGNPLWATSLDSLGNPLPEEQLIHLVEEGQVEEEQINQFIDEVATGNERKRYAISSVTKQQLQYELGVTERQAQAFIDFRGQQTRGSFTLARLKEIPGWDRATIDRVVPFLTEQTSHSSWQDLATRPVRLDYKGAITLSYPQQKHENDSLLLGKPYELQLRTTLETSSFAVGLLADKDRYEPFFDQHIGGFDRYSFFFSAESPLPYLKRVVLGDYSLSLGEGLIVRNSFLRGAYASALQGTSARRSLRPRLVASGYDHFRGAAVLLGTEQMEFLLAYSKQHLDAKLNSNRDSIGSLLFDSPHRTQNEIERRHTAQESSLIARLAYRSLHWEAGVNAIYIHWGGKTLLNYLPGYSQNPFAKHLQNTYNISSDFRYRHPTGRLEVATEVALSPQKQWAALFSSVLRFPSQGDLMLSARALSPYYQARRANSYYQLGAAGNEWGGFLRYCFQDNPWFFESFVDYSSTFLMEQGTEKPLRRLDALFRLNYTLSSRITFFSTVSWKKRFDHGDSKRFLLAMEWKALPTLRVKLRYQRKHFKGDSTEAGNSFVGSLRYTIDPALLFDATFAYYRSDRFKSRQFIYLPRVRYSSGYNLFYGKGWLVASKVQGKWRRWTIDVAFRYHHPLRTTQDEETPIQGKSWEVALSAQFHFSLSK